MGKTDSGRCSYLDILSAYLEKEGYSSSLLSNLGENRKMLPVDRRRGEYIFFEGPDLFDADLSLFIRTCRTMNTEFVAALKFTDDLVHAIPYRLNADNSICRLDDTAIYVDAYNAAGIYYLRGDIHNVLFSDIGGEHKDPLLESLSKGFFHSRHKDVKIFGLPMGGKTFRFSGFNSSGLPEFGRRAPALFLDRDGVIIKDEGYMHGTDLRFIDRIFPLIETANGSDELVIVVTNQSGVARGFFSEREVMITNEYVRGYLEGRGLRVDLFDFCPFMKGGARFLYDKDSLCRKPAPGMILEACEKFDIDLSRSLMVGDQESDRIRLPYLRSVLFR